MISDILHMRDFEYWLYVCDGVKELLERLSQSRDGNLIIGGGWL